MSVIATVEIPASEFPLGTVLESDWNATVSVETTVPTSDGVVPYLWIPRETTEEILAGLDESTNVDDASRIDAVDDSVLVKVEWNDGLNGVLAAVRESDAIVTSAVGTAARWTLRLRFPSYEDLSQFYTDCVDGDISLELVQLHEAVDPQREFRFGLTRAQRELVIAAYEAGYFEVPRKTTLVELADQLEISDSAVSQRLRRGLAALISATLFVESHQSDGTTSGTRPTETASSRRFDPGE
ncbi:helix-turn-helix domain-containing protein [Halobiforma nitratireducens]|uniref:Bacterio-opsin activator HTH domain-containing protein n=1 Tax=Halobiforma nitratireducens JCM 10879 TaxID=1227454 RepID=M0LCR8_9EURY|nr:helix-turn-helix domain-containing protein [Halobiforma nitratireducens]EMA31376.1 bacterio-opsin activator HTH domain-containing protein [Halobiforma nitratireducens JCM 10879]